MKTLFKTLMLFVMFISITSIQAQQNKNYFQISPRVGYDFPTFNNNTPYIDYKGGLEAGISLDYYWKWFGIGADFDYIKNKPESTYPLASISPAITTSNLTEAKITRTFYGIGPSFKHESTSGKFMAELNTRAGFGSIKGGRTLLTGSTANTLNFHAGYNSKNLFSLKGQMRFTYFFKENLGVHFGAYYLRHFDATEELDSSLGYSAGYHPINTDASGNMTLDANGPILRSEPCDCDISSVGVFAGLTIKLPKKAKGCSVCGEDHYPRCCSSCGCGITVTAKDKFSKEVLPNTDVVLVDLAGNITQSGTTNSYGVVVFNDVDPNDYVVKGKLYNVNLDETTIAKKEFKNCLKDGSQIQKLIEYGDLNFILKGTVVECNTPNGIEGVNVILSDKINAGQKNTLSNASGNFIFHLKQASTYALKGNKDGYFSNEVEVTTTQYDRNKSLFIDFEMCVDPCGKAIRLDNIIFNLDKWDILPAAIPDLQKVVKLMQDNPEISVEMSSHTDSRGSHEYNQNLSQKRAQSTVNYLVSEGIALSRLIARGAGETELLNKCADNIECSEDAHRINRRTEFKVVCTQ
ncbi:Carboxypeptidase regulatory-like domain-containing protein [Lutibacter oricola]|uniref:Carboxypeptidase regulatory-like domain-containing protein n=1 Tax=Lutibacter oricola TaxID=762486 RepID=A0A1H3D0W6_9FLAO|nr:OmpA family protein [Lutibacter oricola]SDX60113.1 Carboxypeptidase regulatory-like domain-containing protein [Lutibacter oricola]